MVRVLFLARTLSNDDDDGGGKENGTKSNRFRLATQLCTWSCFFVHFFAVTTTTWNCLISRCMEDVDTRQKFSFSFSELRYSASYFRRNVLFIREVHALRLMWNASYVTRIHGPKTIVISLTNYNARSKSNEPIRSRNVWRSPELRAGKRVPARNHLIWLCFWLVEKIIPDRLANQRA